MWDLFCFFQDKPKETYNREKCTRPGRYHRIASIWLIVYIVIQCFLPYSHFITKVRIQGLHAFSYNFVLYFKLLFAFSQLFSMVFLYLSLGPKLITMIYTCGLKPPMFCLFSASLGLDGRPNHNQLVVQIWSMNHQV